MQLKLLVPFLEKLIGKHWFRCAPIFNSKNFPHENVSKSKSRFFGHIQSVIIINPIANELFVVVAVFLLLCSMCVYVRGVDWSCVYKCSIFSFTLSHTLCLSVSSSRQSIFIIQYRFRSVLFLLVIVKRTHHFAIVIFTRVNSVEFHWIVLFIQRVRVHALPYIFEFESNWYFIWNDFVRKLLVFVSALQRCWKYQVRRWILFTHICSCFFVVVVVVEHFYVGFVFILYSLYISKWYACYVSVPAQNSRTKVMMSNTFTTKLTKTRKRKHTYIYTIRMQTAEHKFQN